MRWVKETYPSSGHDQLPNRALDLVAARLQVMEGLPLRLVVKFE